MFAGPAAVAPCFQRLRAQAPPPLKRRGLCDSASFFISPKDLWTADRRRRCATDHRRAPPRGLRRSAGRAARRRLADSPKARDWIGSLDRDRPVVVACKAAHEMSQMVAADLRAKGYDASVLDGGYAAWSEAGLPLVDKAALDRFAPRRPSLWVTRRRPKIDRVACPVAHSPLHRRRRRASCLSIRLRSPRSRARPAPFRSTSKAWRFRTRAALQLRHHAQAVRTRERAVAGAAGADRARRRHRAARSRAGSRRPARDLARPLGARRRRRSRAARSAASWSTMRCSPICASRRRSVTTGRRRWHEYDDRRSHHSRHKREARPSPSSSRSGSRSAASTSADRPDRSR